MLIGRLVLGIIGIFHGTSLGKNPDGERANLTVYIVSRGRRTSEQLCGAFA